jgi:hypothetical protein
VRILPILRQAIKSHFAFALLISLPTIIWLSSHWTTDYEEMPTFAYSLGRTNDSSFWAWENYEGGEYSLFGVALYDVKQGIGVRLPTQGAWAQNPLGLLRHFLDIESIILIRLFTSLFATIWIVSFTIATIGGKASLARRIFASSIIAATAPFFIGYTDWTSAVVFNWSCIALFTSLIANEHLRDAKNTEAVLNLAIGISIVNLVTEHPGWIPMALVFLGFTLVSLLVYRAPRPKGALLALRSLRASRFIVGLLGIATANLLVIYLDLRNALGELPASYFTQGLGAGREAGYLGFSRGALPWQLEYILGQAINVAFLPLLWLFEPELSRFEVFYQLLNIPPARRAYLALAALPLLLLLRKSNSDPAILRTTRAALAALVATFAYAVFQDIDFIPNFTKTSGTWIVSRAVAGSVAVLLCILLGHRFSERNRIIKTTVTFCLFLSLLLSLFAVGTISPQRTDHSRSFSSLLNSKPKLAIRDRQKKVAPIVSKLKSLSAQRLAFVGSDDLTPMELLKNNFTVVAPLFPKIRSSVPLAILPSNTGLYFARDFDLSQEQYSQRVIDFLNIDTLGVRSEELKICDESRHKELRLKCAGVIEFEDLFAAYSFEGFSTFTQDELITTSPPCALLDFTCPAFEAAVANQSRRNPRLRLCENSCLMEFDFDIDTNRHDKWLLIPLRYDNALQVQDSSNGNQVATVNIGGFIAVSTQNLARTGTLRMLVNPDGYMIARVFLLYGNFMFLTLLVIMVVCATSVIDKSDGCWRRLTLKPGKLEVSKDSSVSW